MIIGDPTSLGWLITIFYLIGFSLSLSAGIGVNKRNKHSKNYENGFIWLVFAAFLLILGVNKQLDLQTLFFSLGRKIAAEGGWYDQRRAVQALFVIIFTFIVLLLLVLSVRWIKGKWKWYGMPFAGALLLLLFVMIRAASLNHVQFGLVFANSTRYILCSILELLGILIMCAGTVQCMIRTRELKYKNFRFDWETERKKP